ncbi:MAG: hypothetical protein RR470_01745 [Vagococcus sp.]|uniref:hypothetical protein n=1 Tax=Vagococcus sp. TaxID=1933889 RepID=UPI002FC58227
MKKRFTLIMLILGLLTLVACSSKYDISNDKKILTVDDSYSINEKNTTSNSTNYKGDIELNGRLTLWEIDVLEKSELTVIYDIKNQKGQVRLALTDNKKYIRTIFKLKKGQTSDDNIKITLTPGKYFIKLVGDDTKFQAKTIKLDYSNKMMKTTHIDSIRDDDN